MYINSVKQLYIVIQLKNIIYDISVLIFTIIILKIVTITNSLTAF